MNRAKEILKEVVAPKKDVRGQVMFYLPKELVKEFQRVCGERNSSKVIEHLMRDFLADLEKK